MAEEEEKPDEITRGKRGNWAKARSSDESEGGVTYSIPDEEEEGNEEAAVEIEVVKVDETAKEDRESAVTVQTRPSLKADYEPWAASKEKSERVTFVNDGPIVVDVDRSAYRTSDIGHWAHRNWSSVSTMVSKAPSTVTSLNEIMMIQYEINELFLDTWCQKNSDGFKELILLGNDLLQRISRNICDQDLKAICDFLAKRPQVVHLNLAYNAISDFGVMTYICPFLKNHTTLKRLNLANNNIEEIGIKSFALVGESLTLEELRLNGNNFGPLGGKALSDLLGMNSHLKVLDIGQTGQDLSSLCSLTVRLRPDYVTGGVYNVKEVPRDTKERKKMIMEAAESENVLLNIPAPSMDIIKISKSSLRYSHMLQSSVWCISPDELKPNTTLEVLVMDRILGHYYYQPITEHFAMLVSNMLKVNESLVEFHFEKNSLTDQDIEILASGLSQNKTLRLINLASNRINDHGAELLAACLPKTALEAVILNHNSIRDNGARALSYYLPATKVRLLDISHNGITDIGMIKILHTLKKPEPLVVLFIWGNPITHTSLLKIKEYLISGILIQDGLDIKVYEVDDRLYHGQYEIADRFKARYYSCENPRDPTLAQQPVRHIDPPVRFTNHNVVYRRKIERFIRNKFDKTIPGTCTF